LYIFDESPSEKVVVRGLSLPLEPLVRQASFLALISETVLQKQPDITPAHSAHSYGFIRYHLSAKITRATSASGREGRERKMMISKCKL